MLKKLFAWRYTAVIIFLLYSLGGTLWYHALESSFYRRFFCGAAACFAAGLICSVGWVWNCNLFRTGRSRRSRRYSDLHPVPHSDLVARQYATAHTERRRRTTSTHKGKKELRWVTTVCFLVLFAGVCFPLSRSYRNFVLSTERGRVEVSLSGGERLVAAGAPLMDRTNHSTDLVFALDGIPTEEVPIERNDKVATVHVVVRNVSAIDVRNARIEIHSNASIRPASSGEVPLSDKDIGVNVSSLPSYRRAQQELDLSVRMTVWERGRQGGLYVTVAGDNLPKYPAVSKVEFVEKRSAAPSATDLRAAVR